MPVIADGFDPVDTLREAFLEMAQRKYPRVPPRHDFDIYTFASANFKGPRDSAPEVYAWSDEQFELTVRVNMARARPPITKEEAVAQVWTDAKELLARPSDQMIGRKPRKNDPRVKVQPIPDCDYSVRLWPGVASCYEYHLDFIRTSTGEDAIAPSNWEIWQTTSPAQFGQGRRISSMERAFGVKRTDLQEEKFLLREGSTYMVKRPGQKDVRFTVPIL
ncbi:hypothetical protein K474DRAFT_1656605 [Panus rudis PR-1116 ss-1]|nr:hypothetical protein K474DRAFT_1656605 [Panus rudis PR-1116 ss-1]